MKWQALLFAFHLCCCWCQVAYSNYELDVQGEAQHGYYITLNIGHPPQNIKLIIDTGSANLAIAISPPFKRKRNIFFRYSDSNTFRKLGSNIAIHYVQGNWSGFLASDLVSISKNHSMRVIVACMTSVHNVFDINSMFTGILGLAYPALSKPNSSVLPFFDTIRKAQNISNVFSLSLCGPSFSKTDILNSSGKLHLGFISTEHYTDEIIYSPIIKERLYEITLTMIRVGSEEIDVNCRELNCPMSSVDTGTTQLLVSPLVYNKILSKIKMYVRERELRLNITENISKFWLNDTAACVSKKYFNISLFPDISLSLYHGGNSSFDLVISPELYLLPWQEFSVENTCFTLGLGVSSFGTIIGSTLLKGYYVVFDRSNKQIGFANSSFCQKEANLKSFVTMPSFILHANYLDCKCDENADALNDSSGVGAGTIILLLLILILSLMMLYWIVSWVQAIRLQSNNQPDTRSLVSEEYKL